MAYAVKERIESETVESDRPGSWGSTFVGYAIVVVFVVLCGYYILSHRQDFAFLGNISLPEAFAAGLLILLSYLVNVFQMKLFLRKFGLRLGFIELAALSGGSILGNLLIPMRGGTAGLAVYLKKVRGLDFEAFGAIYGGTALLVALINAALSLVGLALLALLHGYGHPVLTIVVVGIFALCIVLCIFPPPLNWRTRGLIGLAVRAAHSWHLLTRDRPLLFLAMASFLVISLALILSFYFIYRALGMPLPFSAVIITSSLGNLANLIPLTPGSLGIFDVVVIQVPQLFGLDPARSIAATLVFRALSFLWAFVLGIPGLLYLVRRNGKKA
ncbi:MAG: lysylphosphatidylglycerol synthase transmembrane domain-containing protein [Desulfomonilaceae bacterium]|nr:lysylphosphatidylglycerol synthase transmembrane domain-containing protein [Desulfomonilaceae bacterium]